MVIGKGPSGALSSNARPGLHVPTQLVTEIWKELAVGCFVYGTRGYTFRVQTEKPGQQPHVLRAYADPQEQRGTAPAALEYTLTGIGEIGRHRHPTPRGGCALHLPSVLCAPGGCTFTHPAATPLQPNC